MIRRDLSFLLNTVSHEDDIDAARYPDAAASVLNYGLPPLAGSFSCMNTSGTIFAGPFCVPYIRFEPRLKASTLQIIHFRMSATRAAITHYSLKFAARSLHAALPDGIRVRSALDMEQSRITFLIQRETDRSTATGILQPRTELSAGNRSYQTCRPSFILKSPPDWVCRERISRSVCGANGRGLQLPDRPHAAET
ncbi:GPW/gp25 family protein [Actinoallomurus acanthiterrae]